MTNPKETIELLSCSKTSLDLWDNIYKDSLNKNPILYFMPNQSYKFRLIGPFIRAERIYVGRDNFNGVMGNCRETIDKINSILDGNSSLYEDETRKISDDRLAKAKKAKEAKNSTVVPDLNPVSIRRQPRVLAGAIRGGGFMNLDALSTNTYAGPEVSDLLYRIFTKIGWQKCVMVNALLKPQNMVQIIPFISSLCDGIFQTAPRETKINGLFAHDIEIRKEGFGLNTQFHVDLSDKASGLSKKEVEGIMSDGLIDIEEVLKEHLRMKEGSSYIYRIISSYKMSKELNGEFIKSVKKVDAKNHIDQVEDEINELPLEAFENQISLDNPIASLEL